MATLPSLPFVDISPYLAQDFRWPPTPQQLACSRSIHTACLSPGFFYLTGHGVPRDRRENVLRLARQFFDLSAHRKEHLSIASDINGTDGARGYQRLRENVTQGKADHHEGLDLYRTVSVNRNIPLHGCNQWPDDEDIPAFRPDFEAYIDDMLRIGHALVLATAIGLGLDEYELDEFMLLVDKSFWVMRCIGYPPLPVDAEGISCGAHKDYGCYTLLHATPETGSLQVYLPESKQWLNADPVPDAYVVNIGEMWEIWTNGLYKSTLHRVVHKSQSQRISIPFFFEPNWDAEIRPLDAALRVSDGRHPKAGVNYGEFLTKKVAGNFDTSKKEGNRSRY